MEDLTFVMAISISNVMATTMGRLAMEVVDSVREYRDTGISYFFCGRCTYKSKRRIIYSIFSYFMLVAVILLTYLEISLG